MEPLVLGHRCLLVDDLVPIIVDHFSRDSDAEELTALALISSAWLNPVRNALYASPRLCSYHASYLLSRTLVDCPELGSRVRALHLHPVPRICSTGNKCNCRHINAFALSLAPLFRLQNLSEVSLAGDCAIHAEQYLRSFSHPQTIRKLRVEGMQWYWSFKVDRPVNASLRWTDGLASRFSDLKTLELVNLELRIYEPPQAFKPRPPHLEGLYMDRVRIRCGKLSNLAHNAWNDMRELTFIVSEHGPEYDIHEILTQAAQSLQAFKYFIKEDGGRDDLQTNIGVEALASCTMLLDLQLSVSFGSSALRILGERLERLELLKVFGNYEIDVEEWAAEISQGVFPSLREIYLPIGHELRRLADWEWPALRVGTVRRACAARGISLTYAYLKD